MEVLPSHWRPVNVTGQSLRVYVPYPKRLRTEGREKGATLEAKESSNSRKTYFSVDSV